MNAFTVPPSLGDEKATGARGRISAGLKALRHLAARLRPLDATTLDATTRDILKEIEAIDFSGRFATAEAISEALIRYSPRHGGKQVWAELDRLRVRLAQANTAKLLRALLKKSGSTPDQIVDWVVRSTLHVDGAPAVMRLAGGGERAFTALETAITGIGQCTGFAILAVSLLQAAGYQARVWSVPGHTFLEWRSAQGRWQLEDVDLFPPGHRLPRGLSTWGLLTAYPLWAPLLSALPTLNLTAQAQCFVPSGDDFFQLAVWQVDSASQTPLVQIAHHRVGAIAPESRRIDVRTGLDDDGTPVLLADNPNSTPRILIVSERPFTHTANRLDDAGLQHDVFLFARASSLYTEQTDNGVRRLFALVPAGASNFRVALAMFAGSEVSVFARPLGLGEPHPYLCAGALTVPDTAVPTAECGRGAAAIADIAAAENAFQTVLNDPSPAIKPTAKRYAQGVNPARCAEIIGTLGIPPFTGQVLDAGCGTGGFAMVLAQTAERVAAMDYTGERIEYLNAVLDRLSPRPAIEPSVGSIEAMPYADGSFDHIFCRGVIFITDLPRTIREFYRVLAPGGRVYIDCNADGWNRHLMVERGKANPDARRMGRDTLYNSVWRRFGKDAMDALGRSISTHGLRVRPRADTNLEELLAEMERHRRLSQTDNAAAFTRLELEARLLCEDDHLPVILADMLAVAGGHARAHSATVSSQSWIPEEVEAVARDVGFGDFIWWSAAGSIANAGKRPLEIAPMLADGNNAAAHFQGELSVWNALFQKQQ